MIWLVLRAMLMALGLGSPAGMSVTALSPTATLWLVLVTGALCVLESRRLNEHRFFANLGVSQVTAGLLMVCPALVGEIIFGFVTFP